MSFQQVLKNQKQISNTYLPHNGLLSYSDYGNGGRVGYTYDKWERMVEKKYSDQAAYRYVYDAYGSLARKESLLDQTVTDYQYDMIGRIVGMDSTDGQTLRIAYDSKNRTDYVVSKVGDSSTKTRYLYGNTGANQKAGLIYGVEIDDTPAVSYAYDNMARRTGRTLDLGTDYVTSYGYLAGNEAGTTTALVERLQSGPETWWYAYDAVGNITSISKGETKEAAILQEQYVYDGLGQIIRENSKSQDKTITYRYDGGGNLTERKEYTYSTGELGDPVQTVAYGYGDMNWKDKLTSYDGTEIAYDAIGNPLSYLGKTLIWQNGRQLASLNDTDLTVNYAYDDSGIRIQKTVNGTETKFYLNGTVILTQMTGNERMDFLYDEAGDLLGFKYDGNSYYYIRNLQSDITGILNSAGEQIVSYAYDAWGKLLSVAGSAADTIGKKNPFRYRGYYYDTETGLYYLNSRYYDPDIGRFLNADGYVTTGTGLLDVNMYAYCKNNPVNYSDPSGCLAIAGLLAAAAGAGAGFWAGVFLVGLGIGLMANSLNNLRQGTSSWAKNPPASKSTAKAKEKEESVAVPKQKEKKATVVYRYGGTNPGNLTPKEKDAKTGLSFSTVAPPPGTPAAVTTIEALNATGIVVAIQDKPNHVSVMPASYIGTLQEWIDTGASHPCTLAVKSVVVKWDGEY